MMNEVVDKWAKLTYAEMGKRTVCDMFLEMRREIERQGTELESRDATVRDLSDDLAAAQARVADMEDKARVLKARANALGGDNWRLVSHLGDIVRPYLTEDELEAVRGGNSLPLYVHAPEAGADAKLGHDVRSMPTWTSLTHERQSEWLACIMGQWAKFYPAATPEEALADMRKEATDEPSA